MAIIPPHIVDDIMQTSRIEEVIGGFVNLKRAGSSLKGASPFTDGKTGSFVVSPAKQIFKCFSTGKGGKVVTFLMEKEQMSYPEALRWLADKYNIIIPEETTRIADRALTNDQLKNQVKTKDENQLVKINDGVHTEFYPGSEKIKLKGLIDSKNQRQGVWDYYAENGTHLSMMEYQDGFNMEFSSKDIRQESLSAQVTTD